ncbi:MAG: hypothetical protein B6D39_01025 [Anaerolineae bacterium UTCFX2]|jgi:hypothetical protein|nr:S8 family serine peptidase [Anaerolineales bacterium]OQY94661.1 MAG: hypothetical protein B6D39_01025 [Anaerolineae bacterium UTCFX2]
MDNRTSEKPTGSQEGGFLQRLTTGRGLVVLAAGSALLILIAIAGVWFLLSRPPAPPEALKPPSLEELAQQFPEISRLLLDNKLDSVYKQFMIAYQEGGPDAAYELAQKRGILSSNNEVRMTLELDTTDTDQLAASLEEHGIIVTTVSGNLIDISIPVEVLRASLESDQPGRMFMEISGLQHIIRIRLPVPAQNDVGAVETEGVGVIGAYEWHAAGFTGAGIKIGVLDVGFDGYKDLLGTELPANVLAKSFIAGLEIDQTGIVHGSAVAEIVHDVAPDAELIFADYQTVAEKQAAVDWLLSQGVDMITSSTGSTFGRRDDKGPNAVMVDKVFDQGILWINSSGNTGYTHYRGAFTDTDDDGYHEFAPGDEYLGFSPAGAATLALNWDDWDSGTQDYDMYVLDNDGNEIASSTDAQTGPGSDAGEFIYYEFTDEGPYYLMIYKADADRAVTFDFFLRDGVIEYYNPESSVNTPGDARGAFTVGATDWQTGELADYSSRGPTEDGRLKPDIVAPSNVSSAAYGETWIGTSASCPHVAGAAALVMQAYPDFSPQEVRDFFTSRATEMGQPGPDNDTGYGYLYLGDPPEGVVTAPEPAPTQVVQAPPPTEPGLKPTSTSRPTATPKLEEKPKSAGVDSSSTPVILLLLGCVVLPGFLGLGGIGLFAAVVFTRRSKSRKSSDLDDRQYWDAPDQSFTLPPAYSPGPQPAAGTSCPNCGKQNQPEARFCTNCGFDMRPAEPPVLAVPSRRREKNFCTNCGGPLRPNSRFCPKCGQPIK